MTMLDPNDPTVQAIKSMLAGNATALARLNEHLQAMLPVYIDEYMTSLEIAESSPGSLKLAPTRDTYFKVTGLFVSVPLGTVEASLQLGTQFNLPLQNTTTLITPMQKILEPTEIRQLTFTTGDDNGGQAFLWLWGEAVPKYGKL